MPGIPHLRWTVEDGRELERFTIPEEGCRRRQRRRRRPAPHSISPPQGRSRCRSRSPRSRRGGSITDRGTEGMVRMPSAPGRKSHLMVLQLRPWKAHPGAGSPLPPSANAGSGFRTAHTCMLPGTRTITPATPEAAGRLRTDHVPPKKRYRRNIAGQSR